jgi:hypothetical protein
VLLSVDGGTLAGTSGTLTIAGGGSSLTGETSEDGDWTNYTFHFGFSGASSATATLTFRATQDTGHYGLYPDDYFGDGIKLDNVSVDGTVISTPEPGTLALLAAGLAGLLCYAWRRQR